jgi:hypothetical protein
MQAQAGMTRNLERAAASLAAREDQINRDQQIAEALAGLLETQQTARDAIAQNAAALGEMAQAASAPAAEGEPQPPAGEAAPTPAQLSAADALARATQQFAQAMQATGEGAVAISGQQQVANPEVRAGLEAASQLEGFEMPLSELFGAAGLAAQPQPAGEGQPAAQPAGQAPPAGEAQPGQGQGQPPATPGDLAGQGAPGAQSPSTMGTGFVPQSPQVTAQQVAGAQALSQAAQALAQAAGQPGAPGSPQPGQGQPAPGQTAQTPTPGAPSSTSNTGGAAVAGSQTQNQETPEGPLSLQTAAQADSRAADSAEDSAAAARRFAEDPWFARLPPSLRSAMQSKVRRAPPRGYEELLRRYFEE